ncbi:MAG TPA: ATP-binding protein [Bdellovibrionota bacterium]|jgi:two-component system phosphate regulon sensor histidine kinase PhoR|nr:ATP-binding protein [Bdellovibrionota bacterium]
MTVFWFFTLIIGVSFSLSLLLMAARDIYRLQRLIPRIVEDPTRQHMNPRMLGAASPLVRRLYSSVFELVERLRQSSQQQKIRSFDMQRLLDSMREGVMAVHTSGKVLYYNSAFIDLMNLKRGDLRDPLYVHGMELPLEIRTLIKERSSDLRGFETTLALVPHEETKYYWCKTSPLENWQNEKIGVLLVIHDVTRSKLDEIARREFTANVSHQLRTPLTMIKGYIETLLDEELSEEHRTYLKIVEKHSDQLHQVVDELLTLAKFNDPSVQLDLEPASLSHILKEALKTVAPVAEKKSVAVRYSSQLGDEGHILANSVLLSQAAFNLLENAVKFSPAGSEIFMRVASLDRNAYRIEIEDRGPGIEESEREKIFQRFYRGSDTSSKTKGTGLGLAIVKHIVRAHRGEIYVTEPRGHSGSVFVLTIPKLND